MENLSKMLQKQKEKKTSIGKSLLSILNNGKN